MTSCYLKCNKQPTNQWANMRHLIRVLHSFPCLQELTKYFGRILSLSFEVVFRFATCIHVDQLHNWRKVIFVHHVFRLFLPKQSYSSHYSTLRSRVDPTHHNETLGLRPEVWRVRTRIANFRVCAFNRPLNDHRFGLTQNRCMSLHVKACDSAYVNMYGYVVYTHTHIYIYTQYQYTVLVCVSDTHIMYQTSGLKT